MQLLAFAALGASLLLLVPTADGQGLMSPQPQQAAPSANITDRQLDAAAKAVQRMKTVKETYQKKIDAAAPEDKQRLMSEGNDALEKAVTDQGLTEYRITAPPYRP